MALKATFFGVVPDRSTGMVLDSSAGEWVPYSRWEILGSNPGGEVDTHTGFGPNNILQCLCMVKIISHKLQPDKLNK